jgi:hypothetical protein
MERLLVIHPEIQPVEAHIVYVAYVGWIYSGHARWSVDKLLLTDEDGNKQSFCKDSGQLLFSNVPVRLKLQDGECAVASANHKVQEYPIMPHKQVSQISIYRYHRERNLYI